MYWKVLRLQLSRNSWAAVSAVVIGLAQRDEPAEHHKDDKHNHETIKGGQANLRPLTAVNYANKAPTTKLSEAIEKSRILVERCQVRNGAPGMVVAVTVDGKNVWQEGFGYSDLENGVRCTPETVMRIASISKSITMTVVAKLWQDGKLDLEKPVQEYVKDFPLKTYNDQKVVITGHHLVSHTSGIRHYLKTDVDESVEIKDSDIKEFYLKDKFSTVNDALKLFKDDDLKFKPGTDYLYTTHGWTLVSAIVESVVQIPFATYMTKVFNELGMHHTCLDVHEPLVYNRARYYVKNKQGLVENAPYVDNSYKWAGGGFLSCVTDLARFGNLMLYSYQHLGPVTEQSASKENEGKVVPGYLKKETVERLWTPNLVAKPKDSNSFYGMGWVITPHTENCRYGKQQKFIANHAGGAMGCSSELLIMPSSSNGENPNEAKGVVVAILTNLMGVKLSHIAHEIANNFYDISE